MFKDYEDAMYALNDLFMHNPTHRVDEINEMVMNIARQFDRDPHLVFHDQRKWRPS